MPSPEQHSPLSESGGDIQSGAGHDFTRQDAPLSTFRRQSARVEREIPLNKRLCGLTVPAGSAVSGLSRFPQIFPSSLFLILISLISATGRSGVESWRAPRRQLLRCPFCLAAEGRRFGSVKWQLPLNLMRSCGPVLIGKDEEEGKEEEEAADGD